MCPYSGDFYVRKGALDVLLKRGAVLEKGVFVCDSAGEGNERKRDMMVWRQEERKGQMRNAVEQSVVFRSYFLLGRG